MLRNSRDIIQRLKAGGFVLVSVRGSHHKFRDATGRIVIVTHPRKDIPAGTAASIYRQAGWQKD
ncbi:type II toxin-antitoxin system HicA family toxin [Arvimicrobium flavum]|uniref:type II toxin-antitoxin system HicA family toxin n=1 Tax=Arvimicrobium flavum TaxID=3393320 RepID=UPI00237AA601|nr:type II toxin-antitoxin system HicA family toxin [Mesorhizobium shangrilense]